MKDSLWHWKAALNSGEFLSVPSTLRLLGGWVLVAILCASYRAAASADILPFLQRGRVPETS